METSKVPANLITVVSEDENLKKLLKAADNVGSLEKAEIISASILDLW